jgi:hypothetical protein
MFSLFLLPVLLAAGASSQPQVPGTQPFTIHPESATISAKDLEPARSGICYKIRAYIFERQDDAAPKFVRETTCPPVRPRLNRSEMPKARVIPAE